jgi:NAD(P)-dependent dehydrogenase (short-subunit alcohol dehydrogenase family)
MVSVKDRLVIVVTGCSSGFGRLMVEPLAREGHTVYASLRDASARNVDAQRELVSLSGVGRLPVRVVEIDLTSTAQVRSAVAAIEKEAGRIDVVVNNAGIFPYGITEAFTVEQFQRALDINVTGVFRMNQAVLPMMRKRRSGLLVHISSINGRLAAPFFGLYGASKFAMEALAETFRYELSGFGVDSVIVEPGPFRTGIQSRPEEPQDTLRVEEYGQVAAVASQVLGGLKQMVADPNIPTDPQLVVDAVLNLIATPLGQRPLRTVVGVDFAAGSLNETTSNVTRQALAALGLSHMEHVTGAAQA